jgi:Putative MetA-pathway of phenol degradation
MTGSPIFILEKRPVIIGLALTVLHAHACAQFTDPRMYQNTPVGINQLELAYAYVRANTSIDTSLLVSGAKFNLNQGLIDYTRYFAFLHRMAWVEANVPIANLGGSITGTDIAGSTAGTGDSGYIAGILLKGGPALSQEQFANAVTTTSIGLSLSTTAPTGQYDPKKLLNLGSDRWSFKPELAISKPFGSEQRWVFDAYANTYFYTANTSYRDTEVLRQRALLGLEGHISYTFNNTIWASLDTRYSSGGDTTVSGVNQDNLQQNFIWGSELVVSPNSRNSCTFVFAKAAVHKNGPALTGLTVKYAYTWGKNHR